MVRTGADGMPANDMKFINSRALNLFRSGRIQQIKTRTDKHLFIQANSLPEMRKDITNTKSFSPLILIPQIYLVLSVGALQGKVHVQAASICIGALCYALEEFSHLGKFPEFLTCTDKLQEWNRP